MEDSGSIRKNLEVRASGRNEGPMVVVVDESSKLPLFDGGGQFVNSIKEMRGNGVAIEGAHEEPANNDIIVEELSAEWQYPMRDWQPLGKWWKNRVLPQHGEKRINVEYWKLI